ncbi:MAG: squalene/phytoene synthase family protein [Pseudomonadota bacterium]
MDFSAALRGADRDAYLATLFAPEAVRPSLAALALYQAELSRIVSRANEPLAAEVRLQWWRDAIRDEGFGAGTSVPLVEALRAGMERYAWPADTLCAISEARIHDLYADPFADLDQFDGYAGEVFGAPMQLTAMALATEAFGGRDGLGIARSAGTAAGYGGVVCAAAEAVLGERSRLERGRTHVPDAVWQEAGGANVRDDLAAQRTPPALEAAMTKMITHGLDAAANMLASVAGLPPAVRMAVLPAFGPARALRRGLHNPGAVRQPGPLVRQWHLWRDARRLGR